MGASHVDYMTTKKNWDIGTETIVMFITVLVFILPFTQIIIFTLNGMLTGLFSKPLWPTESQASTISSLTINSILTVIGLAVFSLTETKWLKVLGVVLTMFSGQMLMLFLSDNLPNQDFGLVWMTVSVPPTLTLLTIGLVSKALRDKQIKKGSAE